MPMKWSYLAKLGPGEALDWGGDIPATGWILPDLEDTKVYLKIRELARAGRYSGRQVDWGAMAIRVNGDELLAVLAECYSDLEAGCHGPIVARYVDYARTLGADSSVAFVSVDM